MAKATKTQTSTSRATPQPGTPGQDWAEEGNCISSTERENSGQGSPPKEADLPLLAPKVHRCQSWRCYPTSDFGDSQIIVFRLLCML